MLADSRKKKPSRMVLPKDFSCRKSVFGIYKKKIYSGFSSNDAVIIGKLLQ
jgi:hypothetical protein